MAKPFAPQLVVDPRTPVTFPVIRRGPDACLMSLAGALKCLESLCSSESLEGADEQMNLLKRSELQGLFAMLTDYAEAARLALPEFEPGQSQG